MNNIITIKNLHLAVSALSILAVGLAYGVVPDKVLHPMFDFKFESVDFHNLLRANMGLYVGMSIYWLLGIYDNESWRPATLTNTVFMGGLASGRIISLVLDGFSSTAYLLGLVVELLLMIWGIYNLKKYSNAKYTEGVEKLYQKRT